VTVALALVVAGADIEAKDQFGSTPFLMAADQNHLKDAENTGGDTCSCAAPLPVAADDSFFLKQVSTKMVMMLLANGADVSVSGSLQSRLRSPLTLTPPDSHTLTPSLSHPHTLTPSHPPFAGKVNTRVDTATCRCVPRSYPGTLSNSMEIGNGIYHTEGSY